MSKYRKDLFFLLEKLKNREHFAFSRYSDGEVFVMQNKKLVLEQEHVIVDDQKYNFGYSSDDYKSFNPSEHAFVKDKLLEAFSYKKKNYFVGVGCGKCTCAIRDHISWMKEHYNNGDEHSTTPNLLVNSNYPLFINHYLREFKNHKIIMICSENADLFELPFPVVKDFRVGKNCIVNDHHLINEIKTWIRKEDIKDHLFLFSASSLSEILIYELYKEFDQNTYIDIGTTLHKHMKLGIERNYLRAYWNGQNKPEIFQSCSW